MMPDLSVTNPTASSNWTKTQSQTVSWVTSNDSGVSWLDSWNVFLYDGGGLVAQIATNLSGGTRTMSYTPPNSLENDNDYYILVTGEYFDGDGLP